MAAAHHRAALTGLRKRGYAVARERIEEGDSIYRVAVTAARLAQFDASEPNNRERKPKAKRAAYIIFVLPLWRTHRAVSCERPERE
jgi:hypothetical protein